MCGGCGPQDGSQAPGQWTHERSRAEQEESKKAEGHSLAHVSEDDRLGGHVEAGREGLGGKQHLRADRQGTHARVL